MNLLEVSSKEGPCYFFTPILALFLWYYAGFLCYGFVDVLGRSGCAKVFKNLVVEFIKILADRFNALISTPSSLVPSLPLYSLSLSEGGFAGEAMSIRLLRFLSLVGISFMGEMMEESTAVGLFLCVEGRRVLSFAYLAGERA